MSQALDEQSFVKEASLPGRHTLILYEEGDAAQKILFRIADTAMKAGMHVIYTTRDDDSDDIREHMQDSVLSAEEKGELLHVVRIADPMKHPTDPLKAIKEIQSILFSQAKPPFLIISTLVPEIQSDERANITSMIEEQCQRNFGAECSLVCSYDMNKASHAGRNRWMVNMLESHHDVLFVPKAKPPTGIRMR